MPTRNYFIGASIGESIICEIEKVMHTPGTPDADSLG